MKDYKEYYKIIMESVEATGQKPSIREYLFIKLSDNFLIVALLCLTLLFAGIGICLSFCGKNTNSLTESTGSWVLDVAKLCLGVFLGLFASKKVR